jgi:hypothetical protein
MNALDPTRMTPAERLDEIAEILAAGLTRLHARQSSRLSADRGEGSLDCPGEQSGHANVLTDGGKA